MASEYTWVLSEIITRWRKLTGVSSTSVISDTDLAKRINDYYLNYWPEQAGVDDLRTIWAGTTAPTDDGTIALAQTDVRLSEPVYRNGNDEIKLFRDFELFSREFPDDEQYVDPPTLAVGVSDAAKVKNSAFTYEINGYTYSKAAAETAFSGLSTVPQNKYGAFALKIDTDGDITISEADDNSDGYDTLAEAIEDLDASDGDTAFMGFVTVISTDSGGFVPGTTELSDSAVTDTYTDGRPEARYPPEAVCVYAEKLYVRPRADDIYRITCPQVTRGTALESDDSNALPDVKWGPAIALGDAILYMMEIQKDTENAQVLNEAFEFRIKSISSKYRNQLIGGQVERSF